MRIAHLLLPLTMLLNLGGSAVAEDQHALLNAPARASQHPAEGVDIDALTWASDYSIFMSKDCPPGLRKRALRHLWHTMPPGEELRADPF